MNRKVRQEMAERFGVIICMGLIITFALFLNFCSGTNTEAERWFNKGITHSRLGQHEEALEAYNKAIEIKPEYQDAWYNKGIVLYNLDRHEEALRTFEKVIEFNPDVHDAWRGKGAALQKLGRHEEAIKAYEKAIEKKPDNNNIWYNLA